MPRRPSEASIYSQYNQVLMISLLEGSCRLSHGIYDTTTAVGGGGDMTPMVLRWVLKRDRVSGLVSASARMSAVGI